MAIGEPFKDPMRVVGAYISAESSRDVMEELDGVHRYLTSGDVTGLSWEDLREDYGITEVMLLRRRGLDARVRRRCTCDPPQLQIESSEDGPGP